MEFFPGPPGRVKEAHPVQVGLLFVRSNHVQKLWSPSCYCLYLEQEGRNEVSLSQIDVLFPVTLLPWQL